MLGTTCLQRQLDRCFSQIHAVVSPIVNRLHDVGAMLGEHSRKMIQRAGAVWQMYSQTNQASILYQAALDDAREYRHVDIAAADQHGDTLPCRAGLMIQ